MIRFSRLFHTAMICCSGAGKGIMMGDWKMKIDILGFFCFLEMLKDRKSLLFSSNPSSGNFKDAGLFL